MPECFAPKIQGFGPRFSQNLAPNIPLKPLPCLYLTFIQQALIKYNPSGLSKRVIWRKLATLSITLPKTNPRTRSHKEAKSKPVIVLRESVNKLRKINPLTLATTFKTNKGSVFSDEQYTLLQSPALEPGIKVQ